MTALRLATLEGEYLAAGEPAADIESKADRKRRLATARKQKQRRAEQLAKIRAEAVKVPLELYQGTVSALQAVLEAGGFDGPQAAEEAITMLLHGAARLAASDRHAFEALIAPPSRAEGANAGA